MSVGSFSVDWYSKSAYSDCSYRYQILSLGCTHSYFIPSLPHTNQPFQIASMRTIHIFTCHISVTKTRTENLSGSVLTNHS